MNDEKADAPFAVYASGHAAVVGYSPSADNDSNRWLLTQKLPNHDAPTHDLVTRTSPNPSVRADGKRDELSVSSQVPCSLVTFT